MVGGALDAWACEGLPIETLDILFIENVGNLVRPASYDLGEALRVVLLSVTEGEDKPLEYPTIFNSADLAVITKIDLADESDCSATVYGAINHVPVSRSWRYRPEPKLDWIPGSHDFTPPMYIANVRSVRL